MLKSERWSLLEGYTVSEDKLILTTNKDKPIPVVREVATVKFLGRENGKIGMYVIEETPKEILQKGLIKDMMGTENVYIGVELDDPEAKAYLWKY